MIRTAIRRLFAGPAPRTPSTRWRPALTTLEGRQLLATFVVDSTSNLWIDGYTNLAQAVFEANASPGADVITFSPLFDTPQTLYLRGDLEFKRGFITVVGPAAGVKIAANDPTRVITVGRNARVEMTNVTISGGRALGDYGGGVWNGGVLTLVNSAVTNNLAANYATNSYGGGIFNDYGTLVLLNSTVSNNTAGRDDKDLPRDAFGGGIANYGGTVYLTNSTVSGNAAKGSFVGSSGGGLYNYGTAYITNSTFSGNTADKGAGILNHGDAEVVSSTISQNTGYWGGGLFLWKSLDLWDTIVAGNTGGIKGPDIDGHVHSGGVGNPDGGANLIGKAANSSGWGKSDLTNVDAGLIALAYNGGPTPTMALLPTSRAIGKGVTTHYAGTTNPLLTDQRGLPLHTPPDIGAFQTQAG